MGMQYLALHVFNTQTLFPGPLSLLLLFKGMAQDTTCKFIKTEFVPGIYWVNKIFKGTVKEAISTDYNYDHDSLKYAGFAKWKFNEYGQVTALLQRNHYRLRIRQKRQLHKNTQLCK
jgi:hypothetical protein